MLVAREGGDVDRFYALGEEFIDQYPKSTLRTDVMTALASVASDRGDFVQAAQYLEKTYAADPKGKDALGRLYAAASIHAVLGDAKIVEDLRELRTRNAPDNQVAELLLQTARGGNLTAAQELVAGSGLSGPVPEFLRGYFAYERGDREEAAKRLDTVASGHEGGDPSESEAVARARFLLGEMVFEAFLASGVAGSADLASGIAEKSQLLSAADGAYAQAIQGHDALWALAAMARVSEAYARYSVYLKDLKLPDELAAEERQALGQALTAKANEAEKRAAEIRAACGKRAREHLVFSDVVKGCLVEDAFPEHVPMFPAPSSRKGEPTGAVELRQVLLKNPRATDSLVKLAELYLGTGDLGMALLVLDRAETVDAKRAEIHNLRAIALQRIGEPGAAYAELKKALDLDDKNHEARLNLAAHLALYGYLPEAKRELDKAGGSFSVRGGVGEHPQLNVLSRVLPSGDKK